MTVQHNAYDAILREFNTRNPDIKVLIDYAAGVEDDTDYAAELIVPEDKTMPATILIDCDATVDDALKFIAQGLGAIEAGYDSDDEGVSLAAEHYFSCAQSALMDQRRKH